MVFDNSANSATATATVPVPMSKAQGPTLVQGLRYRVHHFVHTSPRLADAIYGLAFHIQKATRAYKTRKARENPVTFDDLSGLRIDASGSINTGVTNICNAKCTFCAYPRVAADKSLSTGVMSFETFKAIVDEWTESGGGVLDLTPVVGDPLIDPGLLEKIKYALSKPNARKVVMTTNAILLTKGEAYKGIIDAGIGAVYISTEGMDHAYYERVYGVNKYAEMLSGVRHLLEYNRSRGEPAEIGIRFRNAQKPSQIIKSPDFRENVLPFLSDRVRINFTVDFDNWGGMIKPSDLVGNMRMRPAGEQLLVPCQALFRMSVRHDGSVRLCGCRLVRSDLDDLVVGNIKNSSLKELGQSEAAWNLVKAFYNGKRPETCKQCTLYQPITRAWLKKELAEEKRSAQAASRVQG